MNPRGWPECQVCRATPAVLYSRDAPNFKEQLCARCMAARQPGWSPPLAPLPPVHVDHYRRVS